MENKFVTLLLCREPNLWVKALHKYLNDNNIKNIVISDQNFKPSPNLNAVYYEDQLVIDANMHRFDFQHRLRKCPTAWDKAIYHIYTSKLFSYDYYYFIEDDIFCKDLSMFKKFITNMDKFGHDLVTSKIYPKTRADIYDFWVRYKKDIIHPNGEHIYFSFNPLCRLSRAFIKELFAFYDRNNFFYFHEVMLPTVAINNGYKTLDFLKEPSLNTLLGTWLGPGKSNRKMKDLYKLSHPYKINEINQSFRRSSSSHSTKKRSQ